MEFTFRLWKCYFQLWLWDYRHEYHCRFYINLRLKLIKPLIDVVVRNEERRRGRLWHIHLPGIHIANDVYQKTASRGTDPAYYIVPVLTGRFFRYSFGLEDA